LAWDWQGCSVASRGEIGNYAQRLGDELVLRASRHYSFGLVVGCATGAVFPLRCAHFNGGHRGER